MRWVEHPRLPLVEPNDVVVVMQQHPTTVKSQVEAQKIIAIWKKMKICGPSVARKTHERNRAEKGTFLTLWVLKVKQYYCWATNWGLRYLNENWRIFISIQKFAEAGRRKGKAQLRLHKYRGVSWMWSERRRAGHIRAQHEFLSSQFGIEFKGSGGMVLLVLGKDDHRWYVGQISE